MIQQSIVLSRWLILRDLILILGGKYCLFGEEGERTWEQIDILIVPFVHGFNPLIGQSDMNECKILISETTEHAE